VKRSLLIELLAFHANALLAHWVAPTRTNEHAALGELYEGLTPLIDELAEITMGKDGDRRFPTDAYTLAPMAHEDLLAAGIETLSAIHASLVIGRDDDSLNLVADMSALINRARYKLHA
jgi:hypothetical protein